MFSPSNQSPLIEFDRTHGASVRPGWIYRTTVVSEQILESPEWQNGKFSLPSSHQNIPRRKSLRSVGRSLQRDEEGWKLYFLGWRTL